MSFIKTKLKQEKGITLIALSVTIIVLIILAGITIQGVFGEDGLVQQAKETKNKTLDELTSGEDGIEDMKDEYNRIMTFTNSIEEVNEIDPGGPGANEIDPSIPEEPEIPRVEDIKGGEAFDEKTKVVDSKENEIWIPAGFKIASDSGDTVQQGIVIEDVSASGDTNVQGSQYVWIPVGTFTKDNGSTSGNIILGRYTFNTSTGTPTLKQNAANYTQNVVIKDTNYTYGEYTELSTYRQGIVSSGKDGLNATAKDLKGFIDSVKTNGGYYIGRYEASYASGSSTTNYKAASKISNSYSGYMQYVPGRLWNYIAQPDASKVAINTYAGSNSVKSDLINSYAWDTAVVYIQEAGNSNYANKTSKNATLANTGTNADEVCKINDMASNLSELTTEYSNFINNVNNAFPCTQRGGSYIDTYYCTTCRIEDLAIIVSYEFAFGFRLCLYM